MFPWCCTFRTMLNTCYNKQWGKEADSGIIVPPAVKGGATQLPLHHASLTNRVTFLQVTLEGAGIHLLACITQLNNLLH